MNFLFNFFYLLLLSFPLILLPFSTSAQVWQPITGLPTTDGLKAIHFANTLVGWACGENGTLIKTTDSGINWSLQVSGTAQTLRGIFFFDSNTGWACGDQGTIIGTTNGGPT